MELPHVLGFVQPMERQARKADWPTLKLDTSSAWYMELAAMRFLFQTGN